MDLNKKKLDYEAEFTSNIQQLDKLDLDRIKILARQQQIQGAYQLLQELLTPPVLIPEVVQ